MIGTALNIYCQSGFPPVDFPLSYIALPERIPPSEFAAKLYSLVRADFPQWIDLPLSYIALPFGL